MTRFVTLILASFDKQGNAVMGGTAIAVNPALVERVAPVVITLDDAGFPAGGICQLSYTSSKTELVQGTAKDVIRTLSQ